MGWFIIQSNTFLGREEYKCLGFFGGCGFSCRHFVDGLILLGILCLCCLFLLGYLRALLVSTVPKLGTSQVVWILIIISFICVVLGYFQVYYFEVSYFCLWFFSLFVLSGSVR